MRKQLFIPSLVLMPNEIMYMTIPKTRSALVEKKGTNIAAEIKIYDKVNSDRLQNRIASATPAVRSDPAGGRAHLS